MGIFNKFTKKLKSLLGSAKKKAKPAKKAARKPLKKKKVTAKKRVSAKKPSRKKKPAAKVKKKGPKKEKMPSNYVRIGEITHYFPHVKAGVIKLKKGTLSLGDEVHIKGHTTDFKQKITSLQIDHAPVKSVKVKDEAGVGIKDRVRQGDTVYLVKP